ncbi:uncharacterized protein LOC143255259 isoform X2 [Tachypleus tridentatus]|uniref:uncharacterized protein LOC143255259 isoform X2 n=1 Tax=Tachypleus tridentatus TaxID=6853 RepID=UPI003FCF4194
MDDRDQNRRATNRRRNENMDPNGANTMICNCTSYCYFTLAIVLFTVGSVITILALDDSDNMFSSLGHMWLVGPIFISSGLMVAVKTIIYLRRETMLTFLARQRSFLRDWQYPSLEIDGLPRSASVTTLPPPYESVSTMGNNRDASHLLNLQPNASQDNHPEEEPPPNYEEAVLLIGGQPESGTVVPLSRSFIAIEEQENISNSQNTGSSLSEQEMKFLGRVFMMKLCRMDDNCLLWRRRFKSLPPFVFWVVMTSCFPSSD